MTDRRSDVRVFALVFLALALLGCAAEPRVELSEWRFTGPRGGDATLTLPAHLVDRLPDERSTYRLSKRVVVPEAWRGRPISLVVPFLDAPVSLQANGKIAAPLESGVIPGQPSTSSHRFVIDGEQTRGGAIDLDLVIDAQSVRAGYFDTVPRLSPEQSGDLRFQLVKLVNGPMTIVGYAALSLVGFTYFLLYLIDRKRKLYAFFGWQASGPAYYMLELLDVPRSFLGARYLAVFLVTASAVSGLYFARAYFGLTRPGRGFRALVVVMLVLAAVCSGPFGMAERVREVCTVGLAGALIPYQMLLFARLAKEGRRRFEAATLFAAWGTIMLTAPPDLARLVGLGEIAGGAHTAVFGFVTYCALQASTLSRDHVRSLRDADELNVELAARVSLLETRDAENTQLTAELRRQIADRSKRFGEALARIGVLPQRSGALVPGTLVQGHYRVIGPLGAGAMGAVYEIERRGDAKHFALKVLTGATTGAALARLAREAQVAAEVSHPNLVAIADVDVTETGALYIVMELVSGEPLSALRGRFSDRTRGCAVLAQIASGLAALHEKGIIHRDLKLANVLVTEGGDAKICDFGISRLGAANDDDTDPLAPTSVTEPPALAATVAADLGLTKTGMVVGTPLYMAPELGRGGKHASAASDIWAFGVMAYELLEGGLPFSAVPLLEAFAGRTTAPPPPITTLDPMLAALLSSCLHTDPQSRPTAATLERALARSTLVLG